MAPSRWSSTARSTTFGELRAELERAGHRFATTTDTEVIVHGYEQWGRGVFERLRGMFGIALWDSRACARCGSPGIEPASSRSTTSSTTGRLFYGSELKSLLAAGAVERAIDPQALAHYLAFLYTPPDRAIFRGRAEAASRPPPVLARRARHRDAFWTPPNEEMVRVDDAEAEEMLLARLRDAVRSHLVSDVPLGAFLSGGVDSSLVVALMAEASARPVKTFSIGFDEPAYDELDAARLWPQHVGADHHEFVVRPDALAILDRIVAALRRTLRRSVGHSDLVCLGAGAPARHRRLVRRRRRRAVRRVRPLRPARAGRAVRHPTAAGQTNVGRARGAHPAPRRARAAIPAPRGA